MDIREVFAVNLRRLRHERGLSQEDLAHSAEVNRTYMSKLEKAGSYVGTEIVERLAAALEVQPWELLKPAPKRLRKRAS